MLRPCENSLSLGLYAGALVALCSCVSGERSDGSTSPTSTRDSNAPVATTDNGTVSTGDTPDAGASATGQPGGAFAASLACEPDGDAPNHVARFHGVVSFPQGRSLTGELAFIGTGRVELFDSLDTPPSVFDGIHVGGSLAADASTATATEAGGSGLTFQLDLRGGRSIVRDPSGAEHTAKCGPVALPPGVDLVADANLHYVQGADGATDVAIDVTNWGTLALTASSISVRVGDVNTTATLHSYAEGGGPTVGPDERGYLLVSGVTLAECGTGTVTIDADHAAQSGQPDPFGNDTLAVTTPCPLRWSSPITEQTLGEAPPAWLAGKTFDDVVSSRVSGRPDGQLCSACHFDGSGLPYSPAIAQGASLEVRPDALISGRAWRTSDGWAAQFASESIKPDPLRDAFSKWLADGAN